MPTNSGRLATAIALAGALTGWGSAAHAGDPPDSIQGFWPTGATAGAVVLRPNAVADLIDAVERRFGDVSAVATLVARLRTESFGGRRFGAREWGPGLDLDRGLAVFKTKAGTRVVAGSRDAAAAEKSLRELSVLEILTENGQTPRCAAVGAFLQCESGTLTGQGPAPAGAAAPEGALAWFWAGAELEGLSAPGARADVVTGWVTQVGETFSAGAQVGFTFDQGMAALPVSPERAWALLTPKRSADRPSLVHPNAGGALKFDFDLPAALALARAAGTPIEPAIAPALSKLEHGLTGELVMTVDGGFSHPVLLLGLAPGAPGDAALAGLAELIAAAGATTSLSPCTDAPAQTCLEIRVHEVPPGADAAHRLPEGLVPAVAIASTGEPMFTVLLHTARIGDSLVVATSAPDVARRTAPGFVSAPWPASLQSPGASGVTMSGFASLAASLGASPFIKLSRETQWFLDIQTLTSLLGALIDGVDLSFRAESRTARFELTWRTL